MREIALHILDLAQNSLRAGASKVEIEIREDLEDDLLSVRISDDGRGMDPEMSRKVVDPFTTTRSSRRVGMGIPLFRAACESCEGRFELNSEPGEGTEVYGDFRHSHIDRAPLGDMAGVVGGLSASHPGVRFVYRHRRDGREFVFDSSEIESFLDGVPLGNPRVAAWMEEHIKEGLSDIGTNQQV